MPTRPPPAGRDQVLGALDPDRDEARRWLDDELGSGGYQLQEPWLTRLWRWITDRLPDPPDLGSLPPWSTWLVLGLVLAAVAAVLLFASRDRWRAARLLPPRPDGAVLGGARRSAQEYRDSARSALEAGRLDEAVLEGYRAIAADALERTVLDERPGRTAHEVAGELAPVFPRHGAELRLAGDTFDAVRYGDHPASTAQAEAVLELGDRLRQSRPELATAPQSWVPS
ncbi:DUF4129 domain-containing protein [Serinicoccus kebangsaanensis]|uniref:DUF4129 domain-containing protein n=1 Tax=Serinicoccus kebangsaanensis TaxID=2602069 RepID=UPI00124DB99B|nr:DUF4129 domain-containing protein [Serinicoccus kebangsaanensis]